MRYEFPRTLGQPEARANLVQALSRGRFPHALLVHGEPGLGQQALLLDLAEILSCEDPAKRPCGSCPACRAFRANALDSVFYLIPLVKKAKEADDRKATDGEEAPGEAMDSGQVDELLERIQALHRSPYGFSCPEKAQVSVGQARQLIARLGYAEGRRRARPVIIPRLEALNDSAANALLKLLEEPPADVYFLIGSDNRAAILPTLLSRCLHLGLSPLAQRELREAAAGLCARADIPYSARLLPLAEGSPGAYLDLLEQGGEELLGEALRFLSAAVAPDWREFVEYTEQGPAAERGGRALEATASLLHFLLRMLRLHQTLRARHPGEARGAEDGYRWTVRALESDGWDPSLAKELGPLEDLADPAGFAACLQAAHRAVKGYSKPQVALLGAYLEYESRRRPPRLSEAAA